MVDDVERRVEVARRAASEGATLAHELFRTDLSVRTKASKTDVVTRADDDAQDRIVETIREEFPDDAVVGEEGDELETVPEQGPAWVIDPIDGTNNFVRGIGVWATSVAATVDGDPVAAVNVVPPLEETYVVGPDGTTRNGDTVRVSDTSDPDRAVVCPTIWWPKDRREEYARACGAVVRRFGDMRRFGSAQASLSMVAEGALEATITNVDAKPWDTVAGVAMVRGAGGVVTDLEGDPWTHDSRGLVASNGRIHERALAAAREIDPADR